MKRKVRILTALLTICLALCLTSGALADEAAPAAGGDVNAAYVEYLHEWLLAEDAVNDQMDATIIDSEFMPAIEAGSFDVFPADMLFNGMLNSGVAMTFDEFAAQYVPAAPAEAAPAADGDVNAAYVEYLHEWLLAEDAVNDQMDATIIDSEFMPAIEAGSFDVFPADMLFNGMLNSGVAMTFDEFAAQYVPAAPAEAAPAADGDVLPVYEENGQKFIKLSDLTALLQSLFG